MAVTAAAPARGTRLRGSDVVAVLAAQAVVIAAIWIAHGGPDQLGEGPAGILTAIGQVTALYGTYLALIQLVLMSRSPWLDETFGMDGLAVAHRWLGFTTVWLLLAHGIATTVGYALGDGVGVVQEFLTLITTYPYVLMATVERRAVRARRGHVGQGRAPEAGVRDVVRAPPVRVPRDRARVPAPALRRAPTSCTTRWPRSTGSSSMSRPWRSSSPSASASRSARPCGTGSAWPTWSAEGPGVVSLYLTGRELDRLAVRAGQYFLWRFLTPDGWWRSHPYSISAAPNGEWLRITVKDLGDGSRDLARVPIGTRVMVEGPYGILTDVKRTKPGVLLIAGGIGITPLRALLEALPARPGDITLLYRARRPQDVIFRDELEILARRRGIAVHYLIGQRGSSAMPRDPLDARGIVTLVPDVLERDVYVCAPASMMRSTERGAAHARRAAPAGPCRTVRVLGPGTERWS